MLAGLEDHAGGAEQGLSGEALRDVAGQASQHAAIGEGFDHQAGERWATPREAGDGVELRLGQFERQSDRSQQLLGPLGIGVGGLGSPAPGRRRGLHEAGGVGHHADQSAVWSQQALQFRQRDPGGD